MLLTSQTGAAASGVSTPINVDPASLRWAEFTLNVTSAAAAAGDTLNVYVQASSDGGTTWDDFVSFTQVLGNGSTKTYLARWQGQIAPTTAMAAPASGSLAAGTVAQGPHGAKWRIKWVIVSASAPLFTFEVTASGSVRQVS